MEIKFKDNAALNYFYRIVIQGHNEDFTNVQYPDDSTVVCDLTTNLVSRLWDINAPDDLLDKAVIDVKSSVIVKPDES